MIGCPILRAPGEEWDTTAPAPEARLPQILLIPPFAKSAKDGHPISGGGVQMRCLFSERWNSIFTMDTSQRRWIWIAFLWLGFGLVDATQTVFVMRSEGMHHAWGRLFVVTILSFLPWALATETVMRLGRRFPPVKLNSAATWLVHLSCCAGIGLSYAAWATYLDLLLNPYTSSRSPLPFGRLWLDRFSNGIVATMFVYTIILAVTNVLDSRSRLAYQQTETARLNEQLSRAQLDALRRQIEPHFLFNTLNAIAGLVRENRNEDAVSMIARLSDFLRHLLKDSTSQQASLREEVEFVQKYLDIQKVRFVERLQFSVQVPSELMLARVPTLILQLMVENAIKHGIAQRAQGGAILIAASRSQDRLTLSVYNDGPAVRWEKIDHGVGLSNMRTRLQSLYGKAFELNMQNQAPGGVEVSVSVPFEE
jgi:two-component system, LytTR family, sensor kinase